MSEDNSWVFDSLVCFLHGPVWNAPLQNFVEEKSLVFDPNIRPDETNQEYIKIHNEYKNLVDFMLGSFMEEMQITPEQFEIACLEGRNQHQPDNTFSFHQGLFQQIWAANDIKIFIRMMTQRNVELQLQALDLIERRQNSGSTDDEKLDIDGSSGPKENSDDANDDQMTEEIEKVVEKELKMPGGTLKPIIHPISNTSKHLEHDSSSTISEDGREKFDRLNLFFDSHEVSAEKIQSRQEYLRSQRDKILEIKKKARARQFNESTRRNVSASGSGRGNRPTSAQAAQKILEGNSEEILPKNSDAVQLRKTLAIRLRSEVIEKQ